VPSAGEVRRFVVFSIGYVKMYERAESARSHRVRYMVRKIEIVVELFRPFNSRGGM